MPSTTLSRALLLLFMCAVSAFSWYAFREEGPALSLLIEERERLLANKRLEVRDLGYRLYVLEAEIQSLEVDSEESSLMARTLLGMVLPSEFIYQLGSAAPSAQDIAQ